MFRFKIACILLLSVPLLASSKEYQASPLSTIKYMSSYNEYGGGDVRVTLESSSEECPQGYWLNKNDAGFDANLSMLLAAFHSQSNIIIYGLPGVPWPGSSNLYCKIYSVEYHKLASYSTKSVTSRPGLRSVSHYSVFVKSVNFL